ncbi:pyroglutamylated RF-amide peptide receptor [Osmerus eperlanus]|uniref:pyroglutamylated RF-amide peptide receptor n=1 Tax=Osmerus eperlanus TaxID=29151 RepID=UPI002E15AC95
MNLTVQLLDLWLKASNLSRRQFIQQYSIPPLVSVPRLSWPLQPLFGLLYLVIFVLAVVGNVAVLVLLCKRKALQSASTFFICSLALSDLLIAIVCVPATLLQHFFANWLAGDFLCKLVPFLQVTAISTSILMMTCIAVERFQGILYPLHVRNGYFLFHACKMLAAVWLGAVAIAAPLLFIQKVEEKYDFLYDILHTCCLEVWPWVQQRQVYTTCLSVLVFLVPMVTMGVLYGKIIRELWGKHRVHDIMFQTLPGSEINKITRRKKRAVRMMATVVLLFAVCWAPFHAVSLLLEYGLLEMDLNSEFLLMSLVQILGFSNSVCNPLVYAALNTNFKRDLVALLTRRQRTKTRWWSGVAVRRPRGARVGVSEEEGPFPSSRAGRGVTQAGLRQWSRVAWELEAIAPARREPGQGGSSRPFTPLHLFSVRPKNSSSPLLLSVTDPPHSNTAAGIFSGSDATTSQSKPFNF